MVMSVHIKLYYSFPPSCPVLILRMKTRRVSSKEYIGEFDLCLSSAAEISVPELGEDDGGFLSHCGGHHYR